ncbi:NBS-LRR type disease resistance protein [Quillaja saponaria]|uniref:NBS-LRR type disease resistance protein n=1 Tax=Quillaja saponaria TaxID=32244 RepID=A0AAD7KPQ1_QUISA|nr:NBS-LRR type disease resistance protein [Quillaja saponaria]
MTEEIIQIERRISNSIIPHPHEALFPNLETLVISHMDNLKTIWSVVHVSPNSFGKLKSLNIKYCEKLLSIVPSYMLRKLQNLETIKVGNCGSLNEIFRIDGGDEAYGLVDTRLKILSLDGLSKLKHIWNGDPRGIFSFQMLQILEVLHCQNLENIFPASVAKCLQHLEKIDITSCALLETIVATEEAFDKFVFPRLSFISLYALSELKSFYPGPGLHTIECPELKHLDVGQCDKLELLGTKSSNSRETYQVDRQDVEIKQPLFINEKVIPNLEFLALDSKDAMQILNAQSFFHKLEIFGLRSFHNEQAVNFPYGLLQRIPALEYLHVLDCSFKEIFSCGRQMQSKNKPQGLQ